MKKQNTQLKLYNTSFHLEEIDRVLPIDSNNRILELKDILPTPVDIIPFNTDLNVNYSYLSNTEREVKIPKNVVGKFNYVVLEDKTKSTFNKEITYWFATQLPNKSKEKDTFLLSLDSIATFGEEYFTSLENKLVKWSQRHIDRWIPNPEKDPVIWKYSLHGYKKGVNEPDTNLSFVNANFDTKRDIENQIKGAISNWLTSYNKLGTLSWGTSTDIDNPIKRKDINDRVKFTVTSDKIILEREYDKATRSLSWIIIPAGLTSTNDKIVISNITEWKLTGKETEAKLKTSISLPNNSGRVWNKEDIEKWVDSHYRGAVITTDLDVFLNDITKHTTKDIEVKNNKYNQTYSVFGDIRFKRVIKAAISPYGGETTLQYLTEEELKETLSSFEGVGKEGIAIRKQIGDNFTSKDYLIKLVNVDGKELPSRKYTYGDYIKQIQIDTKTHHEFLRHLTGEVFVEYALIESNFLGKIEIVLPEEQNVLGYSKENLKEALTFWVNRPTTLPSTVTLPWSYNKDKLPRGIEKIEYISQTNDDNLGRKIITVRVYPNTKHNIINSDKTNELWQNREFPQLLQAEGSHVYQKPLNLIPNFFGKQNVDNIINEVPYRDDLGIKQRVFYTLASKMMLNRLTHITTNNYYAYVVITSTRLSKVKESFSDRGLDLTQVYNLEEPFVYLPIINVELEQLIESAEKLSNTSPSGGGDSPREVALKKIFNDYIIPSNGVIDKVSGYSFTDPLWIADLYTYFKTVIINNTHRKIKSIFGEGVLKVIISPIPLSQRTPSAVSGKEGRNLFDTYFDIINASAKDDSSQKGSFLSLKTDYASVSDFIEIDFRELDLNEEFDLGVDLPKMLNLEYIERNIEVALLNSTYETHNLKTLLSTNLINLNPRHYYSNANFIVHHKLVQGGVDYDMRFKSQNSDPIFYEQKYSLPFGINEGLKILQSQREQNQARLDEIQRNTEASQIGAGIQGGLGLVTTLASLALGGKTSSIAGYITAGAVSSAGQAGQASLQQQYNDASQRQQLNAQISDSANRQPQQQEAIITESRLNSPFIGNIDAVGYNQKPFNLLITKPNKEFALNVAKEFNDSGYSSNHIAYFKWNDVSSRYYWNFFKIANIAQLSRDFDIPQIIIDNINTQLTEGIRLHWFRDGFRTIDRSLINYETHLMPLVKDDKKMIS